ncbi:VWA domain-containing protein [Tsukamurella tyrosinosolvens]|uniref:VWA domain-containing protein n=1 Tax=Tsukamurella tyrosinosolvens TaxID=57704 RepID=UPI00079353D3|nr:VWA domain-containing protein [Tsukamurella tyrosinosolvens]KXP06894.1 hypothetical protein AXK59_01910 [Tsukamurella tyrosinosolvens]
MIGRSQLRLPEVLGQPQPYQKPLPPSAIPLGPVGTCSGIPTLTILITDDSGSIALPGGADPISGRYRETGEAVRALSEACTCEQELFAVVHFDTPAGDAGPVALSTESIDLVLDALKIPPGATGSSSVMPALQRALHLGGQHPDHALSLVLMTDFELTDADPGAVMETLTALPGSLVAIALGDESGVNTDTRYWGVSFTDPPGSVGRAVMSALTIHRVGEEAPEAGVASAETDPVVQTTTPGSGSDEQVQTTRPTESRAVRSERRAAQSPDRADRVQTVRNLAQ